MKKRKIVSSMLIAMLMSFVVGTSAFAVDVSSEKLEEVTAVEDSNHNIMPLAVSTSKSFSLSIGKSWSLSGIKMGVAFSDPHNAMNVQVKGVSGKYKIIVTSTSGYRYESAEKSSTSSAITVSTNNSDQYTVYVVNTGSTKCTGKVYISSYYR